MQLNSCKCVVGLSFIYCCAFSQTLDMIQHFIKSLILCCSLYGIVLGQDILSPQEFLGYELGTTYTYHHRIYDYMRHLEEGSPEVSWISYGSTSEDRPLGVAVVSSAANQEQLESIRLQHLIQCGFAEGAAGEEDKAIVWLSYNVHGDEASCSEAVMETMYRILTGQVAGARDWLDSLIIVFDPCINPDGRDRYVNWYKQYQSNFEIVSQDAQEHNQPWPEGRYNHYLFDLNRDWIWQTQKETRQRMRLFTQWLPHVHIDFHEMDFNAPYYFAPAARPYHEVITDWQREYQVRTGTNLASYFDERGWLYYTKEVFDLLYPGYGDTWPTYNGAIGFTYEQGGQVGTGIQTQSGDTLRLSDRIDHHVTTGLASIETAYQNRSRLIEEQQSYFEQGQNQPSGDYKTYVIPAKTNSKHRIKALLDLMSLNQIRAERAIRNGPRLRGFHYQTGQEKSYSIKAGDILISAYQPLSRMVQVLFEPETFLEDSLTYDLTAWALPYAYGLDTYATSSRVNGDAITDYFPLVQTPQAPNTKGQPYAFVFSWEDVQHARFLTYLTGEGYTLRYYSEPFSIGENQFARGSIVILRKDNPGMADFAATLRSAAASYSVDLHQLSTGLAVEGSDLGSEKVKVINSSRIAMIIGEGTSATSVGELWHFFEKDLKHPITLIPRNRASSFILADFDIVILPSGAYYEEIEQFMEFARLGGRIIAIGESIGDFTRQQDSLFYTRLGRAVEEERRNPQNNPLNSLAWDFISELPTFGDLKRQELTESSEGSIYKVHLDQTHPLAFGLGDHIHMIKSSPSVYPWLPRGAWNVGTLLRDSYTAGFVGHKLKEKLQNTLMIGVEPVGRGEIIYFVESPIFRGFWHQGKLLLSNAIFFDLDELN